VIDRKGRPLRFLLSGGQCFDGKAAMPLRKPLPPPKKLLADKAYDCAAFRDWLSRRGTTPVIHFIPMRSLTSDTTLMQCGSPSASSARARAIASVYLESARFSARATEEGVGCRSS
jgi:transposase